MSKKFQIVVALCAASFLAACAQPQEEFVVVEPEPISAEPVFTGKYK